MHNMTAINKQHGFYGALAARYASPGHRNAIWDITVKRLGKIHPEKSADEILEFLNGRAGRHLADEIFDGPGTLSYGVAMLNKLKMDSRRITLAQRHAPSRWTSDAVPVRNQKRNAQPPHPQIGGWFAGLCPG